MESPGGTLADDDLRALTQSRAMMSPPHLSPVALNKTHLLGWLITTNACQQIEKISRGDDENGIPAQPGPVLLRGLCPALGLGVST